MPRKPTSYALIAERDLRTLVRSFSARRGDQPLPTVRELGTKYDVSYATISRILKRFCHEAIVWQHPNGRFYPMASRQRVAHGFPIVFLGRQIQNWSVLYREILEGVSEVCTARSCPLIFLSSAKLVRHESPEYPPSFLSARSQREELNRLLASVPRPCGGVILDHLWRDTLATEAAAGFRNTAQLLRPGQGSEASIGSLDYQTGLDIMLPFLAEQGYRRLILAHPFAGDQAVQASADTLRAALAAHPFASLEEADCTTPESRAKLAVSLKRRKERIAVLSVEDHVTALLWREFQHAEVPCPERIGLISLQGTAAVGSSITRLRYDYRLLGREIVSALLDNDQQWRPLRPTLIRGRTLAA